MGATNWTIVKKRVLQKLEAATAIVPDTFLINQNTVSLCTNNLMRQDLAKIKNTNNLTEKELNTYRKELGKDKIEAMKNNVEHVLNTIGALSTSKLIDTIPPCEICGSSKILQHSDSCRRTEKPADEKCACKRKPQTLAKALNIVYAQKLKGHNILLLECVDGAWHTAKTIDTPDDRILRVVSILPEITFTPENLNDTQEATKNQSLTNQQKYQKEADKYEEISRRRIQIVKTFYPILLETKTSRILPYSNLLNIEDLSIAAQALTHAETITAGGSISEGKTIWKKKTPSEKRIQRERAAAIMKGIGYIPEEEAPLLLEPCYECGSRGLHQKNCSHYIKPTKTKQPCECTSSYGKPKQVYYTEKQATQVGIKLSIRNKTNYRLYQCPSSPNKWHLSHYNLIKVEQNQGIVKRNQKTILRHGKLSPGVAIKKTDGTIIKTLKQ